MTGKMELEYEGEQLGANRIARDLIKRAAGEIFEGYFVGIDFARTVQWFDQGNKILLADTAPAIECTTLLEAVPELLETALVPFEFDRSDNARLVAACELVLEGLYAQNKISRNEEGGYTAATKARKDRRGMIYDDLTETGKYS
jgi:magnesium chelatase subunit I